MDPLSKHRADDVTAAAEFHLIARLTANPELDVFRAIHPSPDGCRFALHSRHTGRWYGVLLEVAAAGSDALAPEPGYRPAGDLILAAVVLAQDRVPERSYLVLGSEWADEFGLPGCLVRQHGGSGGQACVGLRTGDPRHRAELDLWYSAERVVPHL